MLFGPGDAQGVFFFALRACVTTDGLVEDLCMFFHGANVMQGGGVFDLFGLQFFCVSVLQIGQLVQQQVFILRNHELFTWLSKRV